MKAKIYKIIKTKTEIEEAAEKTDLYKELYGIRNAPDLDAYRNYKKDADFEKATNQALNILYKNIIIKRVMKTRVKKIVHHVIYSIDRTI